MPAGRFGRLNLSLSFSLALLLVSLFVGRIPPRPNPHNALHFPIKLANTRLEIQSIHDEEDTTKKAHLWERPIVHPVLIFSISLSTAYSVLDKG